MQKIVESTDFMICLAIETTHPTAEQLGSGQAKNYRRLFITAEDRLKQLSNGALEEKALLLTDFEELL